MAIQNCLKHRYHWVHFEIYLKKLRTNVHLAISLSCLPKNYRPPIPAPKTHFIKKNTTAFEILCTYLKQLSMSYNAVSALELFTPEIVFI